MVISCEIKDKNGEISLINANRENPYRLNKIYYINLDNRLDRKQYMETMLSNLNVEYERFSAFKPILENFRKKNTFESSFVKRDNLKEKLFNPNYQAQLLGMIGCLGSYIQLLEKIHSQNPPPNQYIIILEDDAFITQNTLNQIYSTLNDTHFEIDILRINPTFFPNATKLNAVQRIKKYVFKITKNTHYCGGTHINIIPTHKINKILSYLKASQTMPIDSLFSFNYIHSYFLFIFDENSINLPLSRINDIPKEKKPITQQKLNFNHNILKY